MAGTIELCVFGVESQIRYIAYGYCINAVIVKLSTRWGDEIAADAYYSRTGSGFGVESADLYQVLVTCGRGECNLRLPAAEVIVAIDSIGQYREVIATIIDSKHSIELTATEADGNVSGVRSSIAVPDVRAGYTITAAVERCKSGVERQLRYVTDWLCAGPVVIGWW